VIRNNEDVSRVVVGSNKTARRYETGSVRSRVAIQAPRDASGWLAGVVNTAGMWDEICTVCCRLWARL